MVRGFFAATVAFSSDLGAAFGFAAALAFGADVLAAAFSDFTQGVISGTSVPSIRLTVSPISEANCAEALYLVLPLSNSPRDVKPPNGSAA